MSARVVKLGGSLLDWPPLPRALARWLAAQPPAATSVLVCGGGPLTDAIRRAQRNFDLKDETSHWLCVAALSVSARLLAAIIPSAAWCDRFERLTALAASHDPVTVVFDSGEFLLNTEPDLPGTPLPHDWSATTDSIAARLAEVLHADELVLLKSAGPPRGATFHALAAAGYVDGHFPAAAAGVASVRMVNLRTPQWAGAGNCRETGVASPETSVG
jgi:aspartokinase-like uncharacterized kinase